MKKIYILDTNVLLHNPFALKAFDDNHIVIPIQVIEELDTFKSYNDEKGKNARMVARQLDYHRTLGSLGIGVEMKNGGIIQVAIASSKHNSISAVLDNVSKADNAILSVALKLKNDHPKKKVIFVSKDLNARIKADALGITSQDFESQKVDYDVLYKGWCKLDIDDSLIDNYYKDGGFMKKLPVGDKPPIDNEFFLFRGLSSPSKSAIGRYSGKKKAILPLNFEKQELWGIKALNLQQEFAFDLLLDDNLRLVTLVGPAGTGKTLLAIAAGLKKTVDLNKYKRLLVTRPIIPMGKDIGYLPGTKDEKLLHWMQPIFDNLRFLFGNEDGDKKPEERIRYLMDTNLLELEALTYIRGRSIPNQYLIVDEAQNLTPHEIKTILSRAGHGTKIVLTGDPQQIDNPYLDSNSNGLTYAVEHLKNKAIVGHVKLEKSERSSLASLVIDSFE